MKTLLITIFLFAATLTGNANCGGCGTGEKAHSQDKAAKICFSESSSCCSEKKACSDNKKPCDTKEKSCCATCGGDKVGSLEVDGDDKKSCGAAEEATSAATSVIPLPKMSCCPADA